MADGTILTRIRPVWLASYPRSGNTYLRIVLQNLFRLPTYSVYYVEGQDFPDPSADALEGAPRLPRNWRQLLSTDPQAPLTLIKTHDLPDDESPAVYLVRDGRASIDSYYHYQQKFAFDKPSLTEVIAGACQFGSWSGHFRAWAPQSRPNTLFLRYEDLVDRPTETIPQLAQFLQVSPAAGRLPTFEELKQQYPAFFRKGQNQDFLTSWTSGQMALFNALHGSVMETLNYSQPSGADLEPGTIAELAQSAARLHGAYLEQLRKLGISSALCQQLGGEVERAKQAEAEKDRRLNSLLASRWVKLGAFLRALPGEAKNRGRGPTLEHRASSALPSAGQTSTAHR